MELTQYRLSADRSVRRGALLVTAGVLIGLLIAAQVSPGPQTVSETFPEVVSEDWHGNVRRSAH